MSLSLKLTIPRTELLLQENPDCEWVLTNEGPQPVTIAGPETCETLPVFRTLDVKTGAERVHWKERGGWEEEPEEELPRGESTGMTSPLLDHVSIPVGGEYEISALYEFEQEGRRGQVESAPIRVKVHPTTPKNLTLDSVQGAAAYGAWVNVASDPPEIIRSRFEFLPGGGMTELQRVAKGGLRTRPLLSIPPNKSCGGGQWVAWIDGRELHFAHADDELGILSTKKVELPPLEAELVEPLHGEPLEDPKVRPAGAALVWMGDREGTVSRLQAYKFTVEKPWVGAQVDLRGPRPLWMLSQVRSDEKRTALLTQTIEGEVVLSSLHWSETAIERPAKLAAWKGTFVAAGATLDFDDVSHGAALLWTGERKKRLEVVEWQINAKGEFAESGRRTVGWNLAEPIRQAQVRVSARGVVAVLLRDSQGRWFLWERGKPSPLPKAVAKTDLPLELAFLGDFRPVLVCARAESGFRVMQPDGKPLPEKMW